MFVLTIEMLTWIAISLVIVLVYFYLDSTINQEGGRVNTRGRYRDLPSPDPNIGISNTSTTSGTTSGTTSRTMSDKYIKKPANRYRDYYSWSSYNWDWPWEWNWNWGWNSEDDECDQYAVNKCKGNYYWDTCYENKYDECLKYYH